MATYDLDITLLAFAQVTPTTDFGETVNLNSVAQVTVDEDMGIAGAVTLLAFAQVTLEIFIAHQETLNLQAYAQVTIFDESTGQLDLSLDASAQILIDVETLGLEEELLILAFADIMLDIEVQSSGLTRSSGGMFGAAPPVRVRPDILPVYTPTPTRRVKFPTQG